MSFCMGARARAVDEIVDNNTLFSHLMIATSAHFVYMDLNRQLWSALSKGAGVRDYTWSQPL